MARLPGLRRYVENAGIAHRKTCPLDGVAEMWFDSVKDVAIAIAFGGSEAEAVFTHEQEFLGHAEWFIAEETEVPLAPQNEEC